MKKALTIGLVGAALAVTLSFVATSLKSESPVVSEAKADEPEPDPATIVLAQNTASVLNYERGPRIIIVPQAVDRSRASIERDVDEGDDDIAPRRIVAPLGVECAAATGRRSVSDQADAEIRFKT